MLQRSRNGTGSIAAAKEQRCSLNGNHTLPSLHRSGCAVGGAFHGECGHAFSAGAPAGRRLRASGQPVGHGVRTLRSETTSRGAATALASAARHWRGCSGGHHRDAHTAAHAVAGGTDRRPFAAACVTTTSPRFGSDRAVAGPASPLLRLDAECHALGSTTPQQRTAMVTVSRDRARGLSDPRGRHRLRRCTASSRHRHGGRGSCKGDEGCVRDPGLDRPRPARGGS